jgi:cellulose synthase/poly-beta-1,6-N-acetylglucosamine synthase-like glycosyltransferase/spore germination protein YaaH/peptidoglycan/xylan/chitin deacetylase (PgdA/CDA1 family)
MKRDFVFHDPTGRRWRRFRRVARTAAVFFALFAALLVVALITTPQLQTLGLPDVERVVDFSEVRSIIRGERAAKNVPFKLRKVDARMKKEAAKLNYVRSASPVLHPVQSPVVTPQKPVVFGYYVNWDRGSQLSLRQNLKHLTHIVPEWLMLKNAAGDLSDESDSQVIEIARQAQTPILAMVTNYRDGWQGGDVHHILNNADARENLIDNIHANLVEHKFAGVNLDFEQVEKRDRQKLIDFVAALRDRLKPEGFVLSESVPADGDPAYDLARLAELNDYIVPMVYDEHYQSGEPGPVASQDWFEEQLDKLGKVLPPEKTVIGFGNYGYDWIIGSNGAAEVAYNDVMAAAIANKGTVEWDMDTDSPVLRYRNGSAEHEVWFLDAVTALNHIREVSDGGFRGVGLWRLGAEDPGLWKVLANATYPAKDFNAEAIKLLDPQQMVNEYGQGEIIRVTETPREGKRNVWKTADGDFAEKYEILPTYYVVEARGKPKSGQLALTFDDGPSRDFTPGVLDVLKAKHVPATFFVVGANAETYPDLVKRIYDEGHEIGNHTYSHPNIALTSLERTRLELDSTQRLIEHATGASTILFRPPYNADSEPTTAAEILPVLRAQQMGYITIGERIDPRDWAKDATADSIFDEVVAEKENGNIVLLHDAGGNREATIQALPRIIDYFRKEGYTFVPVSAMLGKTRAEVMPPPAASEKRWADLEGEAFSFKSAFQSLVGLLFLVAIWLTVARSVIFGLMAVLQKRKAARRVFDPSYRPPVSVVLAAYNEEKVIRRTVESILSSDYEGLQVVVVDDGSKDRTLEVLREAFGGNPQVKILTQPNGGKSSALNHAIGHATHEILVAVDADTLFGKNTIADLVRHFHNTNVGAVSGNAKVGNRQRWITKFQSIEYVYGFNLDRRALDLVNAITVVPGAVGAWRKSLIIGLGGFGHETLAEDTDLTLAIRRLGYEIRYEEKAIAYTEAPEDVRSLAKQRFRWAYGTLQAAWKHRDATFNPKYGSLGMVALPSIWIFQVALAALSPFADVAMMITLFSGAWQIVLGYYFAFFFVELLAGFLAYWLEGDRPTDLLLLFPQRLFYRQLMHYVLLKSITYAIRGQVVGWGKLERRATVPGA